MRHGHLTLGLAFILAAAAAPIAATGEVETELVLEPSVVGLDEVATLTIRVASGSLGGLSPQPHFELENLEIAAGPFRSSSFRWVNGETSRSLELSWRLRPLAVGKARVLGASVQLGETTRPLPQREIEVVAEPPPGRQVPVPQRRIQDPFEELFGSPFFDRRRPAPPRAQPKVFARAEAHPERPFAGQQVLYTLHLYTQADVHAVNPRALPAFRGFWVREVPQAGDPRPEWVEHDGERYGRVAVLQRALFPLHSGTYEIEPARLDLVVRVAEVGAFGPAFARAEDYQVTSNPVRIEARPLPPAPEGRSGTVGRLVLTAELEPHEVEVGEATTLTVTATGTGNLQGLAEPVLASTPGLRLYPPQATSEEKLVDALLQTSRRWSYVVIPQRPGRHRLPGISIPTFDPESSSWREARSQPQELVVAGVESAATPGTPLPAATQAGAPADSLPPATLTPIGGNRLGPLLPWAGGALAAVAALATLLAVRRTRGGEGISLARRRFRQALTLAAAEERPRSAAAVLEEAWRELLAERWQVPRCTPSPQWAAELRARGADADAAQQLVALADDLHYLRYAPELSSAEALRCELVERSRPLARSLS